MTSAQETDEYTKLIEGFRADAAAQGKHLLEAETAPTDITKEVREAEASDVGSLDLVKMAFNSNNAAQDIYQFADRSLIPTDPTFRLEDHSTSLTSGIPTEYWSSFEGVRSLAEGQQLRDDILKELKDKETLASAGVRGMALSMLAGVVDVDAPLTFVTGGGTKAAQMLAKVGMTGRTAKMLSTAVGGAEAALITSGVSATIGPTGTWRDIPYAGLSGLAFGGAMGTLGKTQAQLDAINTSASKARYEFWEAHQRGDSGVDDPTRPTTSSSVFGEQVQTDSTVGAAQVKPAEQPDMSTTEGLVQRAKAFVQDNELDKQAQKAYTDSPYSRVAEKLYGWLNKTPLVQDFERLFNSKSSVAKVLAYETGESAMGVVRNNTSSSILKKMYQSQVAAPVMLNIDNTYMKYAGSGDIKPGVQADLLSVFTDTSKRLQFYKEVILELESRRLQPGSSTAVNQYVKELADHIDAGSAKAIQVMQGIAGETPMKGSESLKAQSGWWRHAWSGASLNRLLKEGVTEKQIVQAMKASYQKLHPTWQPEWHNKMAEATVRRMKSQLSGIDTNLMRMLQEEGTEYMEQFLKSAGLAQGDITRMIEGLRKVNVETEKAGVVRHRTDIDLREAIPGTQFQLVDLIDMDIPQVWSRYSNRVAGFSSLARKGIQYADRRDLINAIVQEDPELTKEFLEGYFSYFSGDPIAGGINPWASRAMRTTNLRFLGGLGLTQLAETGPMVASMGVSRWKDIVQKVAKAQFNGDMTTTLKQLEPWLKTLHGEEHLLRPDLVLEEMRHSAGMYAEHGAFLDTMLAKGSRLQSVITGFNAVRKAQVGTAVHSMVVKLDDAFRKMIELDTKLDAQVKSGKLTVDEALAKFETGSAKILNPARLQDIGIDTTMRDRLLKYWRNGTVKSVGDNEVDLGFSHWDAEDVQELGASLTRYASQAVQDTNIGEGTVWFNKTEGAILMNLKKFAMLAMTKQTLRHARIADAESIGAFSYGLASAATVVMVRSALNGKDEEPTDIAKQAFMLSNLTGWVPMWTDPLAGMLGMDDLKFSKNYQQGLGGDVVGTPPVFKIGETFHVPEAALKTLTGNADKDDIYTLRATPIIGNLTGMGLIYKSLLDDIEDEKAAAKAK